METVGIRQLKNNLSKYVRQVEGGDVLIVTDRGRVVAEMVPPGSSRRRDIHPGLLEMERRGQIRLATRPNDPNRHGFYLSGSTLLWCAWQVSSCVGIFGGALIPRDWSLEFAAPLALVALLMPLLYDRAVVSGAIASGAVALLARALPLNLGIVAAVAAGVVVGLLVTRVTPVAQVEVAPRGR